MPKHLPSWMVAMTQEHRLHLQAELALTLVAAIASPNEARKLK